MNIISIPRKAIKYVKENYNFDLLSYEDESGDLRMQINHVLAFLIFEECCGGVIDVVDEILERAEESEESFVYKLSRINYVNRKIADKRHSFPNASVAVLEGVKKSVLYFEDFMQILPDGFRYTRDRDTTFAWVRVKVTDENWEPNVDNYGYFDEEAEDGLGNTLEQTAKPQEAVSLVFLSWD